MARRETGATRRRGTRTTYLSLITAGLANVSVADRTTASSASTRSALPAITRQIARLADTTLSGS